MAEHRKLKVLAALEEVSLQEYIRTRVVPAKTTADDDLSPIAKNIIDDNHDPLKRLGNQ